jgi:hypothetical protein
MAVNSSDGKNTILATSKQIIDSLESANGDEQQNHAANMKEISNEEDLRTATTTVLLKKVGFDLEPNKKTKCQLTALRNRKSNHIAIAYNPSEEMLQSDIKKFPFLYIILQLDSESGNYVKVGSGSFQEGVHGFETRHFLSRMRTVIPGSFLVI